MGLINPTIPTIGDPNSSEDLDVRNTLIEMRDVINGNIDSANIISSIVEALVPTGVILPSGLNAAPSGWLICDGSAVSRTTYADLFTALGTTYGAGNGTSTFNLPDLRGRIPMGSGTGAGDGASGSGAITGTALTARTRGQWGGAQAHTLSAAESGVKTHGHSHGLTTPSHSHSFSLSAATHDHLMGANHATNTATGGTANRVTDLLANGGGGHATTTQTTGPLAVTGTISGGNGAAISGSITNKTGEGASSGHNNVQPFLVLTYIVKT